MQTMRTQLDGLWVITEDHTDACLLHLPARPLYDWTGTHEAYCGVRGDAGHYLDDAYALDDADFCVPCAEAQRAQREIIAGLKAVRLADVLGELGGFGIPVTLVASPTGFSTSPDRLYD